MKRIIFNIALIGALLAFVSCKKELKTYDGETQIAFDYPGIAPSASPAHWNGTAASIQGVSITVNPLTLGGNIMTYNYPVTLIASEGQGEIPFTVGVMDASSVTSGAAATSTADPAAYTVATSGSIAAGKFIGTFQITADWSKLSSTSSQNVVYLLLSSGNVKVAENYRRVKVTFVKAGTAPALAPPTVTASIFYANVNGSVTSAGTSAVTKTGILFATDTAGGFNFPSANVIMNREKAPVGTNGVGAIRDTMTGQNLLTPNTKYFVRAYAINATDTAYSPVTAFTTAKFDGGTTTVAAPDYYKKDSATVIVSLTACNDTTYGVQKDTIDEVGIVWAFNNAAPTIDANDGKSVSILKKKGTETLTMGTALTTSGTLTVRSYSKSFSGEITYEKVDVRVAFPSGTTYEASKVTDSSAILAGLLDYNGGIALAEAGFVYGETSIANPTGMPAALGYDSIAEASSMPTSSMSVAIPSEGAKLKPATTYYYRAYFVNRHGLIVYGEEKSFTTN